jgi:Flp pilus assembly protein TadD
MTSPRHDDPPAACACGSGLRVDRCCSLDWTSSLATAGARAGTRSRPHRPGCQAQALLLFGKGALFEAEHHARNAVRLAPSDPQSHNLVGMIMTEAQRPQVGEHYYRRARELTY